MTKEEIILIKELIRETVRSVVKEVITEEFSPVFKKDMGQVKKLLIKSIQENSNVRERPLQKGSLDGILNRESLREAIGGDPRQYKQPPANIPVLRISEEQGMQMSQNGSLPDIDAPIPFINKSSIAWKDFKEKLT